MKIYIYEGFTLKIGNSAKENDELISAAAQEDLWFHLEKFSSPHGVLSGDLSKLDNITLIWAAENVKANSAKRCKNLKNIGVEYIPIKFIQKTSECGKVLLRKKPKVLKV